MKFDDYSYFIDNNIVIPEPWHRPVLEMCIDIDKIIRPWYIPRCVLNAIKENKDNNISQFKFLIKLLTKRHKHCHITQIKSKFATLQVKGIFDPICQSIITLSKGKCNNICEHCGSTLNVKHVGISGWVTNLCPKCIIKLKGNDSSNGNNPGIS